MSNTTSKRARAAIFRILGVLDSGANPEDKDPTQFTAIKDQDPDRTYLLVNYVS